MNPGVRVRRYGPITHKKTSMPQSDTTGPTKVLGPESARKAESRVPRHNGRTRGHGPAEPPEQRDPNTEFHRGRGDTRDHRTITRTKSVSVWTNTRVSPWWDNPSLVLYPRGAQTHPRHLSQPSGTETPPDTCPLPPGTGTHPTQPPGTGRTGTHLSRSTVSRIPTLPTSPDSGGPERAEPKGSTHK